MPEDRYVWLPKSSILSFEEIDRLVGIATGLGVRKVRLTGGEPLLRVDVVDLVRRLARHRVDLAMTTNGVRLAKYAAELRGTGLGRLTVSLDTVRPDRYRTFARGARFDAVVEGIEAARAAGFSRLKINAVVIRDFNDDELVDLLDFAAAREAEVRFIEYMDVGGATGWSMDQVVSRADMVARVEAALGPVTPLSRADDPSAPAERFRTADGRVFGIIASTTAPFCRDCDRARLTADGILFSCLYADDGLDLRAPIREGESDEALTKRIATRWGARTDRGAEMRSGVRDRGALYQLEGLRANPHREMHTRGG